MIALTETDGGVPLYQIKITLKQSKPRIWRRVIVRADMPLHRFHNVIQIVMGWTDTHLHQFHAGQNRYVIFNPDFPEMSDDALNEKRYTVADIAPAAKKKFIYEYDFGDSWYHEVLVEKVLPPDPDLKHPVCLAGENACPPEDCGGIWGYYNKLEILKDLKHPAHEETKEWMGDEWDPKSFDLDETNSVLKGLKA
jgi:hypothetical protein